VQHEQFTDRGLAHRASVTLQCEARQGTRPWVAVRLEDLSQNGFRIAALPHVSPDQPLRVRIPGMQVLTAKIRWHQGKSVGCEFVEPLHVAVFDHIVRQVRIGR
jgi:hypothetical protein